MRIAGAPFAFVIATGLLAAGAAAAESRESATIVDSGSTNTAGYAIEVWSDASASVTYRNGTGLPARPKSFTIPAALAAHFFADLRAARAGAAKAALCLKSASFGTSTHVRWQGWTSPDLDCPPNDKLTAALVKDVAAIRAAGNVTTPLHGFPGGPPRVIVSPMPT